MRKALSNRETLVYRKLRAAAEAGLPCPSNRELAGERGSYASSGLDVIHVLANKGYIAVHRRDPRQRRIEILDTGQSTDWAGRDTPRSVDRISLTDDEIADAREAARRRRREREDYWLQKEAETYGLPRKGRPISRMVA